MKNQCQLFLLFIFCIIIINCTPNHQVSHTADVDTLKALTQEYASIFSSGDTIKISTFVSTFLDEQVELMSPDGHHVVGKQQVGEYLLGFARTYDIDIKFSGEEFYAGGDWAIHRYNYNMKATPTTVGDVLKELGYGLHVFHRQQDGSWKLSKDMWTPTPQKNIN